MPIIEDMHTRTSPLDGRTKVLIEDMTVAICQKTNCLSADGMCGHRRLATELVLATIDHYIDVFDRAGNHTSVALLRGEM